MITINARYPWSWIRLDPVACVDREDLNGKQARRVLEAVEKELKKYWSLYHPGAHEYFGGLENWLKHCKEETKLKALERRYMERSYITKELDELSQAEISSMDEDTREFYEELASR